MDPASVVRACALLKLSAAPSLPSSLNIKVWAIVTMIGSGFFFSFVVGRMASVMSKLDSVRNAHSEKLETVTTFLKDVDLPRAMSKRCVPAALPTKGETAVHRSLTQLTCTNHNIQGARVFQKAAGQAV